MEPLHRSAFTKTISADPRDEFEQKLSLVRTGEKTEKEENSPS